MKKDKQTNITPKGENFRTGFSIRRKNTSSEDGGKVGGTKIAEELYRTVTAPQEPNLFSEIEETSPEYIKAKEAGSLAVVGAFGLNLTIEGDAVFKELIKHAIKENRDILKALPRVEDYSASLPRRQWEDSYSKPLSAIITLTDLTKNATGGERGGDFETVRKALREFLDKEITIQDGDGKVRIIRPITWTEQSLERRDDGEAIRLDYTLHRLFSFAFVNHNITEPDNFPLILRGRNLPNMAAKLRDILWLNARNVSSFENGIYRKKKSELFKDIITLPEDVKRYKKDPKRRETAFNKTLERFREILLLIPGKHTENGKEVEDNGYFETISQTSGEVISNFRINPKFPELLADGEIENLEKKRK